MKFLEKMRSIKKAEIALAKKQLPLEKLRKKATESKQPFKKAPAKKGIALIAEFKKSSPSKGKINPNASISGFVRLYDKYADAVSMLTEQKFFSGKTDFTR